MTPISAPEYALIFSAVPTMGLALVLVQDPAIAGAMGIALSPLVDGLCGLPLPTFWCIVPSPMPSMAVVQVVAFLAFVVASLGAAGLVLSPGYAMPANYVPADTPRWLPWFAAALLLFLLAGGQLVPRHGSPWHWTGLVFTATAMILGVMMARGLAISLKFGKQPGQGKEGR